MSIKDLGAMRLGLLSPTPRKDSRYTFNIENIASLGIVHVGVPPNSHSFSFILFRIKGL